MQLELGAGLGPLGGPRCSLWQAAGLPSGPGDSSARFLRPDQRNQSAGKPEAGQGPQSAPLICPRHITHTVCLLSEFSTKELLENFFRCPRRKDFTLGTHSLQHQWLPQQIPLQALSTCAQMITFWSSECTFQFAFFSYTTSSSEAELLQVCALFIAECQLLAEKPRHAARCT